MIEHYKMPDDLSTVVVFDKETEQFYTKAHAAIFVASLLTSPLAYLSFLLYLPSFLLNPFYTLVAQCRYKLFGKFGSDADEDACRYNPALKQYIVDRNRFFPFDSTRKE
eukprot:TRINITY_DN113_c0_g1_i2.p2 TRINITY_DN113_c0_g1~~TRINITY_DN113_c0_g1_i2.p2  ORF type:complete len:109 (-),score=3.69 TRINITY_DN113_c0_g1_i2:61-387(-)